MWSSVLGKIRPQTLLSAFTRSGVGWSEIRPLSGVLGCGHLRSGIGRACGAGDGHELVRQGQYREMATSNYKHKKLLKRAKGYRGRSKNVFKIAIQKVEKALQHAYRDRKNKKRDFRKLWIERINAGVRQHGMGYSSFIHQAKLADVELNRKVLSEMAVTEPYSFRAVVETVKAKGGLGVRAGERVVATEDDDAAQNPLPSG